MHYPRLHLSLHLLLLGSSLGAAKRRGGGADVTGSGDGGDNSGDGGSGSSGSSGGAPPPPTGPACAATQPACVCTMIDPRQDLYEMPGLYYNGTLTISHTLDANSAWDAGGLLASPTAGGSQNCATSQDNEPKTYEYPALLYVGPKGNDSDTNPVFWALRAFMPPEPSSLGSTQYLDVRTRWVLLRSSDFVITDGSLQSQVVGQYHYFESDATYAHRATRVYWDTRVSGSGSGNIFDVSATYVARPPEYKVNALAFGKLPDGQGPRSSQYVTLSDVCYYQQQSWWVNSMPGSSSVPKNNPFLYTTTPTLWFDLGATAKMANVGADEATFTMNGSATNTIPFVTSFRPSCSSDGTVRNFLDSLFAMNRFRTNPNIPGFMWNVSAQIGLSFSGSKVAENSTFVTALRDDLPVFNETFERASQSSNSGEGSEAIRVRVQWTVGGILLASTLWLAHLIS